MLKIIAIKKDLTDRLRYTYNVAMMVKSGEISEQDGIDLINCYHGEIVIGWDKYIEQAKGWGQPG